ncbi:hypothetical protein [Shewanella algidipiscicola]|uniref:hypothetical protein n=1 Tax=Shewanella algidipiscicola TaxID=614070 RepID=UPI0013A5B04A|nr:hypothetical protein [Shewanella algidipiscicola]
MTLTIKQPIVLISVPRRHRHCLRLLVNQYCCETDMDALVEFDVKKLVDLFVQGDTLSIHVFMAPVSISFV